MCAISAVVVDLPLVPVIATNGALLRARGAFPGEQLDVADDLRRPPPSRARPSSAAWDGSAARRARAPKPRISTNPPFADRPAQTPASAACSRAASLSSQAATVAPPAQARAASRRPSRRGRTKRRACPQGIDRRHRHLNFRVARPTIASTMAIIQKRMTICGSDQPSCSK